MINPANDSFESADIPPPPDSRPAKALGVILFLVQMALVAALIFLLGLALAALFGPVDTEIFETKEASPGGYMAAIFYAAGNLLVMIVVVWQLRKLVATLRAGDPFVPQNALRLRYIWIAVAIGELARTILQPFLERVDPGAALTINVRAHVWFFILVLIVLAQVFREGARLRAEARLTV